MKKLILIIITLFTISFVNAQDSTKVDNFQQTDKILSEVVKKAVTVAEKTGEFVIEQAPLLLQEFYRWEMLKSVFFIIIWLIVFFFGIYISKIFSYKTLEDVPENKRHNYFQESDGRYYYSTYDQSEAYIFSLITKYLSYFAFIGVFVWVYKLCYLYTAPKLYLIEYFIK